MGLRELRFMLPITESGEALESTIGRSLEFTVNASRVGAAGGLRTYTLAVLACLKLTYGEVEVASPDGFAEVEGVKLIRLPEQFASSSRVMRLRALIWLGYCAVAFPVPRGRRLFSTTHHVVPFRRGQIVTVHDIRPYYLPDTWIQGFYFRYLLPRSLRSCDGILTVSEASKRELISVYGISAEKIYVVPNAIGMPPPNRRVAENGEAPYLLMVGASWPHKNATELLERHRLWSERYRLKIVAGRGQYVGVLRGLITELGIGDRVELLDSVSEDHLHRLYYGCAALVYPSRIEGFGIPPLEAMAHGRPAIVSDIPVFRELFRDVPLYVRLGDEGSWAEAFKGLAAMGEGDAERRRDGVRLAESFSLQRMRDGLAGALGSIWGPE